MIVRKIIHIDMDAFFAAVEQRDHPEWRNRPIAVGGSSDRGVVAAASYEARKYGVRSAMPSRTAAKLCPHLIFVPHRFGVYQEVSRQIHEIFKTYTDIIEPLSLDEAYLDVTENKKGMKSATVIAKSIRNEIESVTNLTASAGISINKFLAKIASDINKPNGQRLIPPEDAEEFIAQLRISKFPYIGKKTAEKMYQLGIFHGRDLKKMSLESLQKNFGKHGLYYYQVVRCEQDSPVVANRIRKSIGAESTFERDLSSKEEVVQQLDKIGKTVWKRVMHKETYGRTLTVKFKTNEFEQFTRSRTKEHFINTPQEMDKTVGEILDDLEWPLKPLRLLGISFSNLNTEVKEEKKDPVQLTLTF